MTTQHRSIVDAKEFLAIQLECAACKTVISQTPEKFIAPPRCPSCKAEWMQQGGVDSALVDQLIDCIKRMRQGHPERVGIRFELEAEAR